MIPNAINFNAEEILKDNNIPAYIKLAVKDLTANGYMTPGEFFESISSSDLEHIMGTIDDLVEYQREFENNPEAVRGISDAHYLMLLAIVLAIGEGMMSVTDDNAEMIFNTFCMLTTLEVLARKGLIKVHRDKFSFVYLDDVIAENLD